MDNAVRNFIIATVDFRKGITGKDLMLALVTEFLYLDNEVLRRAPAELAHDGEIFEVEYLVPGAKSQSLFLPRGSVVMVGPNFTFDGLKK